MRTCIQTFGINGEAISKPFVCKKFIRGMMMKERSITLKEKSAHHDQSKKILERLMDDKIFFFDSVNAYIMNCIDVDDRTEIRKYTKDEKERFQNEPNRR